MSQYNNLVFEKNDCIGVLTINRPKVLNALNRETMTELKDLVEKIAFDKDVAVVVITGSGDKSFVAGADISEMRNMSALDAREWGKFSQAVFNSIENLPQPVIAAVNGYALGGGCELAMSCDIRLASEKAKFGQPEVLLGVVPGFAGTQRLPRLIGKGRAKELLFTGDQIGAEEAYRLGLVNRVVPADQLVTVAMEMAKKIMSRGPVAVQLCKAAVNEGLDMDFESGQAYEAEVFGLCFATADQKEGMTAFVEKRKAQFLGK
ncbi:Crotonyl-CoA hydratase [Sporomusa rhizae]|uniref:short-chain-enoyl-CoA hydratase n=1 Tax=Sporomusa rhizae TaxID=357999 RepID=UPI00352B88CD